MAVGFKAREGFDEKRYDPIDPWPREDALRTQLNKIYGQAVVKWNITFANNFETSWASEIRNTPRASKAASEGMFP